MPDVKHAGGISECRRIAALAETRNIPVAPHSPAGPVSTIAGVHLAASIRNFLILEYAFGEVPWREQLISPPERVEGGSCPCRRPRPGGGAQSGNRSGAPGMGGNLVRHPAVTVAAVAALTGLSFSPAVGFELGSHPVRAELFASRAPVRAGDPFELGVKLEIDEGWHTYWRYAGAAGAPSHVDWRLPPDCRRGSCAGRRAEVRRAGPGGVRVRRRDPAQRRGQGGPGGRGFPRHRRRGRLACLPRGLHPRRHPADPGAAAFRYRVTRQRGSLRTAPPAPSLALGGPGRAGAPAAPGRRRAGGWGNGGPDHHPEGRGRS